MNVLVFGGTFDPPHAAHSALPPLAARRLECRRLIYVPAAINPLKTDLEPAPTAHRLAMLRLAVAGVPGAEISTIELDRPGPSYMVDTLEALRGDLGESAATFLLMGSDQALDFHRWKQWPRILELATPAVMVRPPLDDDSYRQALGRAYAADEAARWLGWTVDVPAMAVCATDVRRRLAAGERTEDLLLPAVREYIRAHRLYGA